MSDKKNRERKGLVILLLIICLYILTVVGIAIYVKLDKEGYFASGSKSSQTKTTLLQERPDSKIEVENSEIKISPAELVEEELHEAQEQKTEVQPVASLVKDEMVEELNLDQNISVIEEEADDMEILSTYERGQTIADVPARPRPVIETVEIDSVIKTDNDVLSASDLSLEIVKEKSFFTSLKESIASFFSSISNFFTNLFSSNDTGKVNKLSAEKSRMLEEIEAELTEMQPRFTSYTETNGVTWIDHVDKPNPYADNGFYMYLGLTPKGHVYHRIVVRYSGEEWIELKNVLLQTNLSDKALIIDAYENYQTKEVIENNSKNEWVDLSPTQENNELLNIAVSSDMVKITFMGDLKNVEWVLSEKDMISLRESMYYYNLLKEKENILN